MKASNFDRLKQLEDLQMKIDEVSQSELNQNKVLEDEVVMNLSGILASDDSRRAAYQLAYDEKQQITAVSFFNILMFLK